MTRKIYRRHLPIISALALSLVGLLVSASHAQTQQKKNLAANAQGGTTGKTQARDGETIFKENCSRCHNAPEQLSPRISGSIVRHMRVRASLSEEDAKAVLKFLNP